ncbi:MAG: glycine C-acetyltransferase [Gammaproteobacteria bacterium]
MLDLIEYVAGQLNGIQSAGLYKAERIISSPQGSIVRLESGQSVSNFCANNYLGLASHPALISAAKSALERYGYGLASVRFICGTQTIHRNLENDISQFLGTEDTILYSSCFDANTGFFETLFTEEDAIFSDSLNHASIIDGVRLSKAQRFRYEHNNLTDLEDKLKSCQARFKVIATDGVFSMDGHIANLPAIYNLAQQYNALTFVDDSHAVGFWGPSGRGTPEFYGLHGKIDILTGTLGKALGGASGGYTSGRKEIITYLRQKSRPYLYSNSLAPMMVASGIETLKLIKAHPELRVQLMENTEYFRMRLKGLGFNIMAGEHPIVPIMIGDAKQATDMANALLREGIYVIGFSYPVVPIGEARIRVQLSAEHSRAQLEHALHAFEKIGKVLKIIE